MQPVHVAHKGGKGLQIVHRCLRCGAERVNRVATETVQPDDLRALIELSTGAPEAAARATRTRRRR